MDGQKIDEPLSTISCNGANPLYNQGIDINGAFVIMNYPDSEINGVYIAGSH